MGRVCLSVVALVAVAVAGCSVSSSSGQSEADFLQDAGVTLLTFQKHRNQLFQSVRQSRGDPTQVANAIASYGSTLSGLERNLSATTPPDQCQHVKQTYLDFVGQEKAWAAKYSLPSAVDTNAELAQMHRDSAAIEQRLMAGLGPPNQKIKC
jgi:hypothetical protein